jgi:signal transduction histidine kinase
MRGVAPSAADTHRKTTIRIAVASRPSTDDRPALWPHWGADPVLREDVRRQLQLADGFALGDPVQACELVEEALLRLRADAAPRALAHGLHWAAGILRRAGQATRAYVLCLEAEPIFEREDERWRATRVLQSRGRCCLQVGEYERAETLLSEAAGRFERMPDLTELARCQTLVAVTHLRIGDLDAAVEWADRAVAMLPANSSLRIVCRLRNNAAFARLCLGQRYAANADVGAARLEYVRARATLPNLDPVDLVQRDVVGAALLDTMIGVALANADAGATRESLCRLIAWSRRWGGASERGMAWSRLAEWHQLRGCPRRAIACLRRATTSLSKVPRQSGLPAALLMLADLLEAEGDAQGAYDTYCRAMRVEAEQQRRSIALRAELLALDSEAESERRKTEQTLAYAQRLSNVGHMVASVNHELNQPMASIRMSAETALELIGQGAHVEVPEMIRLMLRLSTRLNDVASKLAAFPSRREARLQRVRLADAVDEALATLGSRFAQTPCKVDVEVGEWAVLAHEGQLVRVLANLANNALDALVVHASPGIAFAASLRDGMVHLRVADNGPGLSSAAQERLFQPFFTTKAAGQGLGLGLALSRDVVREMGGDLTAVAATGGGAVFEIRLPHADR